MTKRNHDLLRDVLDELCVTPIYTAACARCSISTKSLWSPAAFIALVERSRKISSMGVTPMTKRNHDLLRDVLDELCVTPIYTAACARCSISTKSLWRYVRASQREDDAESYRLVWCDVEDWFHNHLRQAMRMSALMIEATARHHALHGFDEVQTFQGKLCWKEDPKLAGLSNDDLARLGREDRYERNPDGSLVPRAA